MRNSCTDASFWMNRSMSDLGRRLKVLEKPIVGRAKNVVFFLGDGMSLATVTAARVHMKQSSGKSLTDENESLTFEKFPYTGLARVWCSVLSDDNNVYSPYILIIRVKSRTATRYFVSSVDRL